MIVMLHSGGRWYPAYLALNKITNLFEVITVHNSGFERRKDAFRGATEELKLRVEQTYGYDDSNFYVHEDVPWDGESMLVTTEKDDKGTISFRWLAGDTEDMKKCKELAFGPPVLTSPL